jgi:TolB-like protein/DNA-binding winged helix-turn-helix (wHTH) protein/Tfp pilus assembly protein PilF
VNRSAAAANGNEPAGYAVDDLVIDVDRHRVMRGDTEIPLPGLSFDLLLALVRTAPKLLTYDQLMERVWPGIVVNQETMSQRVKLVRDALGDDPHSPRYIAGVRGRGYRIIPSVACQFAPSPETRPENIPTAAQVSTMLPRVEAARTLVRRRWLIAAVAGTAIVAAAITVVTRMRADSSLAKTEESILVTQAPRTIAVLPFVSVGGDPENEYFSDGLSDELINVLSGIHGLKVTGRTSSFYFKGRNERPEVIGRTLRVTHLLEGSVRKVGPQLRITAQLVEAGSGYQLWSDIYLRESGDVLAIQEDIARSVATSLRIRLLPADEVRIVRRGTDDPEAHRLYLVARGKLRERGLASLRAAKALFEEVTRRDPNYVDAYAGLAESHFLLLLNHGKQSEDSEQLGRNAVEHALTLNANSSDAISARANFERIRYERHGELEGKQRAIADYRRAIELDPTNARALHWYGALILEDDPDRALELLRKALELDPLERVFQLSIAQFFFGRGHYADARKYYQEAIDRYPDYDDAYGDAALLEHAFGHLAAARALWQKSFELAPEWWKASIIHLISRDLGDFVTAEEWLSRIAGSPVADLDREVSRLLMAKRGREVPALLERAIAAGVDDIDDQWIVLSAASWSLIVGKPERAIAQVEQVFPEAAAKETPIRLFNCDAAIVLAASWQRTGQHAKARSLLGRVAGWLDGPRAPGYPSLLVARAQVHGLLGENERAFQALNRAYDAGYRYTYPVAGSLLPQIAIDGEDNPLFDNLRTDPRLAAWFARIRADNARQLSELNRAAQARSP